MRVVLVVHRLCRGGDGPANNPLHCVALARTSSDPRIRAFVNSRTGHRPLQKDVVHPLQPAIARETFRLLTQPCDIDDYGDLRQARHTENFP
ncbi:hypothetical protein [Mycobacterium avium]|uniref:hypothetical protein n=1 Tax=Mycobacterium avium TaxID=1764 RepID=UPI0009FDFD67|nr:hypothetical protein [Mycobacterium avium]PBJ30340.1 hypothetical protein BI294_22775 [Mycobacterium avium subsp. hominissuis]